MITGQIVVQPSERFPLAEDFAAELAAGGTITSAIAKSRNDATLVDSTATFLSAGPPAQIDGSIVTTEKRAGGGAHGETHVVTIEIDTSLGGHYEHEIEVLVCQA